MAKNVNSWTDEELKIIYQVCMNKTESESWDSIADTLNEQLGVCYDESTYRKLFSSFQNIFHAISDELYDDSYLKRLQEKEERLYKQQVRTQDIVREYRKILRDESRIETLKECIQDRADGLDKLNLLDCKVEQRYNQDFVEGFLSLSDWHIGDTFKNFTNEFNLEIAQRKLNKLLEQVVDYCKMFNVDRLNVLNLGDLVEGVIHVTGRITSELDIIQQIKITAELLSQFLVGLIGCSKEITLRYTLDNHSRVTANYKESIEKESFGELIMWYVEARLKDTPIKIINDNLDANIGHFKSYYGKNIFFAHGHLEKIENVLETMTFGSGTIADYVFLGHYHQVATKEKYFRKIYVNGSLKGVDTYALKNRLFARTSQSLLILKGADELDFRINLD